MTRGYLTPPVICILAIEPCAYARIGDVDWRGMGYSRRPGGEGPVRGLGRVFKPLSAEEWEVSAWLLPVNPFPALLSAKNLCTISLLSCFLSIHILSFLLLSAMKLSPSLSARFTQSGPDPQGIPTSLSTPSSMSSSTSTSAYEFGLEMGIIPSATMLSAPVPVQAPVQHPSIPFVPASARMAEFERLREEIRKTERQVEMLHILADEASHGLDVPQVRLVSPSLPSLDVVCAFAVVDIWVVLAQRSDGSHCPHPCPAVRLPHSP